jgi:hypothetical protein
MNKFFKNSKALAIATLSAVSAIMATTPAHAALDLTGVAIDTSDYMLVAAIVIGGLATIWGVKKVLSLLNR